MDETMHEEVDRDDRSLDAPAPSDPDPVAPSDPLAALDELLRRPLAILQRRRRGGDASLFYLAAGALVCCALYGGASGFFQGGGQILVASQMRPVLWRGEGEALFAPRKMFFLEHFSRIAVGKEGAAAEEGD